MLMLPTCPFCGSKNDYAWVKKHLHDKPLVCRSCKKKLTVVYKRYALGLAAVFFAITLAISTAYMFFSKNQTVLPDLIFILVMIFAYLALVPLCVRYRKIDGQEPPAEKLKKNRHRHKKIKNTDVKFDENPLEGTSFDN